MPPAHLYRELQQHLDRMPVGFPATASGVEIRILKHLFSPEEAAVALELSIIPEPVPVIHRRLKKRYTEAGLAEVLREMGSKGLINVLPGPVYGKLPFILGFYERQLKRLTPEFERDCREYMAEAFHTAFHTGKTTQMRTVPVNKPVPVERNVASYDDIRAYVESVPGPFARMTCICRHGKDLLGESCRQTLQRENCLTLGIAAKIMVEIGQAEFISREQMRETMDAADLEGLVLQTENTQKPLFVCCCCGCCCGVLTSARRLPAPADFISTLHYAEVDPGACDACGVCETRCQMDAFTRVDDKPRVDRSRCIGCALCVTTCPSDAILLKDRPGTRTLPANTQALYTRLLEERYGKLGLLQVAAKRLLGAKS